MAAIAGRQRDGARTLVGLLAALLLAAGLLVVPSPPQAAAYKPWGRLRSHDAVLGPGCQKHSFRYRVDPPRDEWLAVMRVVSPDGTGLHHTAKDSGFDPERGRVRFTVCRASTEFGRHKLKMHVKWYEDDPAHTKHGGWVKPSYFRLKRP